MPYLKRQNIGYQISVQNDRTTTGAAWLDFAPDADALAIETSHDMIDLDVDSGLSGELYSDVGAKNTQPLSGSVNLYPTVAGSFFDAVVKRTAEQQSYFGLKRWWSAILAGSEDKGEEARGCIFNSFSLDLGRANRNEPIKFAFQFWMNTKRRILTGASVPTWDHCKCFPYGTAGLKFDFVDGLINTAYGADQADVQSVSLSYDNQGSVEGIQDNLSDAPAHRVWLYHVPGTPVGRVSITLRVSRDELMRIDEFTEVPRAKLRIACVHPKGTSITSTSTVSSGSTGNQVLLVASTTGFEVGDVVLITHPSTNYFATAVISAISTDTSITISGYDSRVSMNGASSGPLTIRNMAWGCVIDRMDFVKRSTTKRAGAFQTITIDYAIKLLAGSTFPFEYHAYNHANSRIS